MRLRATVLLVLLVLFFHLSSFAFEIPDTWKEVGTVQEWMDLDSHFYRIEGLTGTPGPQVYDFDQITVYEKTMEYEASLPRISYLDFLALNEEEQEQRQSAAAAELKLVKRFRYRIVDIVMRIQTQYDVGWGKRTMDYRAVGDMLGKLQTAVGLDPGNAFAWHLLAYFSANSGDQLRALDALDHCEEILSVMPDTVLTDVRFRAALDRAWILRDMGYFDQASEVLDLVETDDTRNQETHLLRGLIAAQTGNMNRAFEIAADLNTCQVPVFQMDWESMQLGAAILDPQAWPPRPSGHLKAWVLATAWLVDGNPRMAAKAMPWFNLDRHYKMGHRFLSEAAVIYEATGRPDFAGRAWAMAHMYVPYYPYMVFKPYGLSIESFTGRTPGLPFVLAFDTHMTTGSRLAYGVALVSQAVAETDRRTQVDLAGRAVHELEICLRSGIATAAAALGIGYAQAVLGNPFEMIRATEIGMEALARPDQDQTCRDALERVRGTALDTQVLPGLESWIGQQDGYPGKPAEWESRLRATYAAYPNNDDARRNLARFLIRRGDPVEGAQLIEEPLAAEGDPTSEDWVLILELDRLRNQSDRAEQMLTTLKNGRADQWTDPHMWILVGIICEEHGVEGSRMALEYALALEPENVALKSHLDTTRP